MNFAETRFWEILVSALLVILALRIAVQHVRPTAGRFDKLALMSLGLILLFCVSWVTFVIFLLVAVGTYVGLRWILRHRPAARIRLLFVLIPLQLLPLFFYKYAHFFVNSVLGMDVDALRSLVIPAGISFYSFQKVSFVIDTLHFKKPLPRFIDYMNFAGFFPQVVAGPIERRDQLLPQMEEFRFRWSKDCINDGASWIALGFFFKCCLADNLATFFDPSSTSNAYLIWLANILFGLRIYYDFAGYSLIALGVAMALGIRLTMNFASPYCATSPTEFWRRWHITLSQWFRDYLYLPLGGARTRLWAFNILVVFIVSGVWHGAGWNFVAWGALHALLLIANRQLRPMLGIPETAGWLLTISSVTFAWLAFYELRPMTLATKAQVLLKPNSYGGSALLEAFAKVDSGDKYVLCCLLTLVACVLVAEWLSIRLHNRPYCLLRRPVVLIGLVGLTMLLAPVTNNGFIYFAF